MDTSLNRLVAGIAYIPIIGWLYILIFKRQDEFAMFHVRQSIGLFLFLIFLFLGWAAFGWLISWLPYGMLIAVTLFAIIIVAVGFGVVAWIMGIIYALQGRVAFLPIFGRMANRLRI